MAQKYFFKSIYIPMDTSSSSSENFEQTILVDLPPDAPSGTENYQADVALQGFRFDTTQDTVTSGQDAFYGLYALASYTKAATSVTVKGWLHCSGGGSLKIEKDRAAYVIASLIITYDV